MSSAWPPPTPGGTPSFDEHPSGPGPGWFGTPEDRIVLEPTQVSTRPEQRRSVLTPVLVSIVVLASIGALAVFFVGRTDAEPELDGTNFSFALATTEDTVATSMEISSRQEIDGSWIEIEYRIDRPSLRLEATMRGEGDRLDDWGITAGETNRYVVDDRARVTFTSANAWSTGWEEGDAAAADVLEDDDWVSSDVYWWDEESGIIETAFTEAIAVDQFFGGVDPIDRGFDRIDGEWVRRYDVVIVVEELLADEPWALSGYEDTGIDELESFTYTVWVTESNAIRRTELDVREQGVDVVVNADAILSDERIDITLPDPATVISSDDLWDQVEDLTGSTAAWSEIVGAGD